MKNIIERIKNSNGFVSLEVIMIAGALIILGAFILYYFNGHADKIATSAGKQLTIANEKMNGTN